MIKKVNDNRPNNKDYVIEPCGRMGRDTCVSQLGGAFIGQFGDMQLAKMAVKIDMQDKQRNRNMWYKKPDGTYEIALQADRKDIKIL